MATAIRKRKKLDPELKALVAETVYEILNDPDRGFDLTERTKRRLRAAAKGGQKWISHAEVKKRLY